MLGKAMETQREPITVTADVDLELVAVGIDRPGFDPRILESVWDDSVQCVCRGRLAAACAGLRGEVTAVPV